MARIEIKHFKTSREGKTALRNYIRKALKKCRARWSGPYGKWGNESVGQIDESILVDRIGVRIMKWSTYYDAVIVCVYDTSKPVTFDRFDGQEYQVIHTWNDMEFYKVWEMINRMSCRILKLPH